MSRQLACRLWSVAVTFLIACGDDAKPAPAPKEERAWQVLIEKAPGALLRVAGTTEHGVFVVGADADGEGPLVYQLKNALLERLQTGEHGSLWWWHQTASDTLHMVGDRGLVLAYQPSTGGFRRLAVPVQERLFGVWSAASDDVWYVGGNLDQGTGTVLHGDGIEVAVPDALAGAVLPGPMFKVTGFGTSSVWMVGARGRLLHCDGQRFEPSDPPTTLSLLSVSGVDEHDLYAAGGAANGVILHRKDEVWLNETPAHLPPMNSVWSVDAEHAYAAGFNGHLYARSADGWQEFAPAPPTYQDIHSVWVDDDGGIWLAGGRMTVDPPTDGVLLYYGPTVWKTTP
jgi:hypothetical protein